MILVGGIPMLANHSYEFGEFRLEPRDRLLFRNGELVALTPKVFDTLRLLVEHHGHTLEKDRLLKEIWPDTFVAEGTLTRNIYVLRKTLGDSSQGNEYIATVPKYGYRFVAPVMERTDSAAAPASALDKAVEHRPLEPRIPRVSAARSLGRWILALASVSLVVTITYVSWRSNAARYAAPTGKVMLAVLPFANLTGDPAQEFISDGLTEEMITQLGGLNPQQLGVIARTSAMTYKGTNKPVKQIGRELGVNYVLEGSLRLWGDRVRISAQLIDVRDQTHLWAENYDSDRRDILKLQSDVTRNIAKQISLTLTAEQRATVTSARSVDPQVYELCLLGRYQWNKRNQAGLNKAIDYFQQAISRNPAYAPAYAGLADAYAVLTYYSTVPATETFPKARTAAQRALQLDEKLPEAHTTLGLVSLFYSDLPGADREFKRALQLNPNYATAHHWNAFYLWRTNRHDEALAEIESARQLDPLSLIINSDEGKLLYDSRHPERAVTQLRKAIELDPNFGEAHRVIALAYMQIGASSQAISQARRAMDLFPDDPAAPATLGYVYAVAGDTQQAQKILVALKQHADQDSNSPYFLAVVYTGLGNRDKALECLEKVYQGHSRMMLYDLTFQPVFDPLRTDQRFQDLLQRVKDMRAAD
jgi:TolB-like protein/DNA-binding winged helix-turn-helix (wHTH) protein/lipoprotein NlpI